jgi:hypothetical protein
LTPGGAATAWEATEIEGPFFAALRAFFLMMRGSPFSVTCSLTVCLHHMAEESAEKDILVNGWMDGLNV